MDYQKMIDESLLYINKNLEKSLTIEAIAKYMGYSPFHFARIFSFITGLSVAEYVRKQRLNLARRELLIQTKVIDVALNQGYESASGFTKSFRQEFGYTPRAYKNKMTLSNAESLDNLREKIKPPHLIKQPSFHIAGYYLTTSLLEQGFSYEAAYWDSFSEVQLESKLYEQLKPKKHGEFGVWFPSEIKNKAVYLFGVRAENQNLVTSEMMNFEIPAATYAVFTTPPVDNRKTATTYDKDPLAIAVKDTWRYLFSEGLDKYHVKVAESKFSYEYYDERCHASKEAVMDILIPIK